MMGGAQGGRGFGDLAQRANPQISDPMQNRNNQGLPRGRNIMGGAQGGGAGQPGGRFVTTPGQQDPTFVPSGPVAGQPGYQGRRQPQRQPPKMPSGTQLPPERRVMTTPGGGAAGGAKPFRAPPPVPYSPSPLPGTLGQAGPINWGALGAQEQQPRQQGREADIGRLLGTFAPGGRGGYRPPPPTGRAGK